MEWIITIIPYNMDYSMAYSIDDFKIASHLPTEIHPQVFKQISPTSVSWNSSPTNWIGSLIQQKIMLDVWTAKDWALHIYRDQMLCGSLGPILVPMSSLLLIMLWWLNNSYGK